MDRDDVVGAKAAAQHFIELYPYVYATGDLEEWRALSDPECIFCTSVIDNVEDLHGDGGYGVGPSLEIRSVEGGDPVEGSIYFRVAIDVLQGSAAQYSASGDMLESREGGANTLLLAVERSPEHRWMIREVQVEPADASA